MGWTLRPAAAVVRGAEGTRVIGAGGALPALVEEEEEGEEEEA